MPPENERLGSLSSSSGWSLQQYETRHHRCITISHVNWERKKDATSLFPSRIRDRYTVPRDYVTRLIEKQKAINQLVRSHTAQAQMRQKRNHDKRMKGTKPFEIGDYVWVFIKVLPRGGTGKLLRGWRGPFQVIEKHQEGRKVICVVIRAQSSFRTP